MRYEIQAVALLVFLHAMSGCTGHREDETSRPPAVAIANTSVEGSPLDTATTSLKLREIAFLGDEAKRQRVSLLVDLATEIAGRDASAPNAGDRFSEVAEGPQGCRHLNRLAAVWLLPGSSKRDLTQPDWGAFIDDLIEKFPSDELAAMTENPLQAADRPSLQNILTRLSKAEGQFLAKHVLEDYQYGHKHDSTSCGEEIKQIVKSDSFRANLQSALLLVSSAQSPGQLSESELRRVLLAFDVLHHGSDLLQAWPSSNGNSGISNHQILKQVMSSTGTWDAAIREAKRWEHEGQSLVLLTSKGSRGSVFGIPATIVSMSGEKHIYFPWLDRLGAASASYAVSFESFRPASPDNGSPLLIPCLALKSPNPLTLVLPSNPAIPEAFPPLNLLVNRIQPLKALQQPNTESVSPGVGDFSAAAVRLKVKPGAMAPLTIHIGAPRFKNPIDPAPPMAEVPSPTANVLDTGSQDALTITIPYTNNVAELLQRFLPSSKPGFSFTDVPRELQKGWGLAKAASFTPIGLDSLRSRIAGALSPPINEDDQKLRVEPSGHFVYQDRKTTDVYSLASPPTTTGLVIADRVHILSGPTGMSTKLADLIPITVAQVSNNPVYRSWQVDAANGNFNGIPANLAKLMGDSSASLIRIVDLIQPNAVEVPQTAVSRDTATETNGDSPVARALVELLSPYRASEFASPSQRQNFIDSLAMWLNNNGLSRQIEDLETKEFSVAMKDFGSTAATVNIAEGFSSLPMPHLLEDFFSNTHQRDRETNPNIGASLPVAFLSEPIFPAFGGRGVMSKNGLLRLPIPASSDGANSNKPFWQLTYRWQLVNGAPQLIFSGPRLIDNDRDIFVGRYFRRDDISTKSLRKTIQPAQGGMFTKRQWKLQGLITGIRETGSPSARTFAVHVEDATDSTSSEPIPAITEYLAAFERVEGEQPQWRVVNWTPLVHTENRSIERAQIAAMVLSALAQNSDLRTTPVANAFHDFLEDFALKSEEVSLDILPGKDIRSLDNPTELAATSSHDAQLSLVDVVLTFKDDQSLDRNENNKWIQFPLAAGVHLHCAKKLFESWTTSFQSALSSTSLISQYGGLDSFINELTEPISHITLPGELSIPVSVLSPGMQDGKLQFAPSLLTRDTDPKKAPTVKLKIGGPFEEVTFRLMFRPTVEHQNKVSIDCTPEFTDVAAPFWSSMLQTSFEWDLSSQNSVRSLPDQIRNAFWLRVRQLAKQEFTDWLVPDSEILLREWDPSNPASIRFGFNAQHGSLEFDVSALLKLPTAGRRTLLEFGNLSDVFVEGITLPAIPDSLQPWVSVALAPSQLTLHALPPCLQGSQYIAKVIVDVKAGSNSADHKIAILLPRDGKSFAIDWSDSHTISFLQSVVPATLDLDAGFPTPLKAVGDFYETLMSGLPKNSTFVKTTASMRLVDHKSIKLTAEWNINIPGLDTTAEMATARIEGKLELDPCRGAHPTWSWSYHPIKLDLPKEQLLQLMKGFCGQLPFGGLGVAVKIGVAVNDKDIKYIEYKELQNLVKTDLEAKWNGQDDSQSILNERKALLELSLDLQELGCTVIIKHVVLDLRTLQLSRCHTPMTAVRTDLGGDKPTFTLGGVSVTLDLTKIPDDTDALSIPFTLTPAAKVLDSCGLQASLLTLDGTLDIDLASRNIALQCNKKPVDYLRSVAETLLNQMLANLADRFGPMRFGEEDNVSCSFLPQSVRLALAEHETKVFATCLATLSGGSLFNSELQTDVHLSLTIHHKDEDKLDLRVDVRPTTLQKITAALSILGEIFGFESPKAITYDPDTRVLSIRVSGSFYRVGTLETTLTIGFGKETPGLRCEKIKVISMRPIPIPGTPLVMHRISGTFFVDAPPDKTDGISEEAAAAIYRQSADLIAAAHIGLAADSAGLLFKIDGEAFTRLRRFQWFATTAEMRALVLFRLAESDSLVAWKNGLRVTGSFGYGFPTVDKPDVLSLNGKLDAEIQSCDDFSADIDGVVRVLGKDLANTTNRFMSHNGGARLTSTGELSLPCDTSVSTAITADFSQAGLLTAAWINLSATTAVPGPAGKVDLKIAASGSVNLTSPHETRVSGTINYSCDTCGQGTVTLPPCRLDDLTSDFLKGLINLKLKKPKWPPDNSHGPGDEPGEKGTEDEGKGEPPQPPSGGSRPPAGSKPSGMPPLPENDNTEEKPKVPALATSINAVGNAKRGDNRRYWKNETSAEGKIIFAWEEILQAKVKTLDGEHSDELKSLVHGVLNCCEDGLSNELDTRELDERSIPLMALWLQEYVQLETRDGSATANLTENSREKIDSVAAASIALLALNDLLETSDILRSEPIAIAVRDALANALISASRDKPGTPEVIGDGYFNHKDNKDIQWWAHSLTTTPNGSSGDMLPTHLAVLALKRAAFTRRVDRLPSQAIFVPSLIEKVNEATARSRLTVSSERFPLPEGVDDSIKHSDKRWKWHSGLHYWMCSADSTRVAAPSTESVNKSRLKEGNVSNSGKLSQSPRNGDYSASPHQGNPSKLCLAMQKQVFELGVFSLMADLVDDNTFRKDQVLAALEYRINEYNAMATVPSENKNSGWYYTITDQTNEGWKAEAKKKNWKDPPFPSESERRWLAIAHCLAVLEFYRVSDIVNASAAAADQSRRP